MNLTILGANKTELKLGGGLTVLFSYNMPVACVWTNGKSNTAYKTSKTWSNTTQRHINSWIAGWTLSDCITKEQEYFDNLTQNA